MSLKPIIAITMGDPAGIGPEVTAKALAHDQVWECSRPLVVGALAVLQRMTSWAVQAVGFPWHLATRRGAV